MNAVEMTALSSHGVRVVSNISVMNGNRLILGAAAAQGCSSVEGLGGAAAEVRDVCGLGYQLLEIRLLVRERGVLLRVVSAASASHARVVVGLDRVVALLVLLIRSIHLRILLLLLIDDMQMFINHFVN